MQRRAVVIASRLLRDGIIKVTTRLPWLLLVAATAMAQDSTGASNLALPTDNHGLFSGGGAEFYQYIIRDFQGVKTTPWEGGQYGFVRNPVDTAAGRFYTRFHEGIDIRPVHRDANGEPLDQVRAIADGKVVHVNLVPGYSNYGKYVVVEHHWNGSDYYSLYGHLASTAVTPGARVERGAVLGILGYTGDGLDRARAHVHLELNLLLSRHFGGWHSATFKDEPNRHGIYNGINLTGIDIAALYLALRKQPSLTIPEFLAREDVAYKVLLPPSKSFDLPQRYPWMIKGAADTAPRAWEVSFTKSGIPVRIAPSDKPVAAPELSYFKKSAANYAYVTRGALTGAGNRATLTDSARRLMQLLIFPQ